MMHWPPFEIEDILDRELILRLSAPKYVSFVFIPSLPPPDRASALSANPSSHIGVDVSRLRSNCIFSKLQPT